MAFSRAVRLKTYPHCVHGGSRVHAMWEFGMRGLGGSSIKYKTICRWTLLNHRHSILRALGEWLRVFFDSWLNRTRCAPCYIRVGEKGVWLAKINRMSGLNTHTEGHEALLTVALVDLQMVENKWRNHIYSYIHDASKLAAFCGRICFVWCAILYLNRSDFKWDFNVCKFYLE